MYTTIHEKDFHLTCNLLLHYLVKFKNATDFDIILNKLLTCSRGHFEDYNALCSLIISVKYIR